MGVDYSPVLYVGKEFEYQSEARAFYEQYFELSEKDEEYIEQKNFNEFVSCFDNGLSGEILNYYKNCGYVLGIDLRNAVRKPEEFNQKVQDAISKWKELFGDTEYEIIHTVCVS